MYYSELAMESMKVSETYLIQIVGVRKHLMNTKRNLNLDIKIQNY